MWYIAAIILIIVGILDSHISSVAAIIMSFLLCFISVNTINNTALRKSGKKVLCIVFTMFMVSAFIASQSFLNGQSFYVVDSVEYIERYIETSSWSWSKTFSHLFYTYFYFLDDNGLFNEVLAFWAYIANHYFDGASVFYLTLLQTLFGVLASLEIFKIFSYYFEPTKAAKYSCMFALLSLFHIYSIVIIRDIVIAYFYMLGLRIIIGTPKMSNIIILLIVTIATIGIRLYTGLFFGTFVMLWLYKFIKYKKYAKYKIILIPIIFVGVGFVVASLASSVLLESTTNQIEEYDEYYSEGSGLVSKIRQLPFGLRHIVILFFSQLPLISFNRLLTSASFSNLYLSVLAMVYQFFGFIVFYGLMYYCFFKGLFKRMDFYDKWILVILLIFVAITLSTHIDVRRSMEAIPFFFLYYMLLANKYYPQKKYVVNRVLFALGLLLLLSYNIVV